MKHLRKTNGLNVIPAAICLATSASFAVLFSGCKVDQAADVAVYRKVLHASPTTAPAHPLDPKQPLSLRKALVLANNHNESLSISGEDYLQALISQRRAVEAFFTPTVDASAGYSLNGSGHSSNTISFAGRTNHSLQLSLSEQVNLFNGFRDIHAIHRDQYLSEQRRWQLLDLQNSILLDVANVYYGVLISESSVAVLRDTVSLDDQRIGNQNAQLQQGIVKPLDVRQSEADAANTRVQLTRAINDVRNGRASLANVIGVPLVDNPLGDDLPDPPAEYQLDTLISDALASRQDLQAADAAIQAAYQNVKIAIGEYYPSVNLDLSQALYRDPASFSNWASSLPVSIPIFTAGAIHQDVRAAWSQFRQAALTKSQLLRQVATDVRTAYYNLISSADQLHDIYYEVAAAESAYKLSVQSATIGTATNLDVLTAQNQFLTARLDLVTEQLNHKLYFLQLLRAQGRLTIPRIPATHPSTVPATRPTTYPGQPHI